jgi:hypothetical protein
MNANDAFKYFIIIPLVILVQTGLKPPEWEL